MVDVQWYIRSIRDHLLTKQMRPRIDAIDDLRQGKMQWRPLKSERWKSSKRRTAKQKHQLANLHAKHHLNDENIPPPQDSLLIPSNRSHTGAIDALTHQLDVLKDRAITYKRKYQNERKRNSRKDMALMSLKNQYNSLSTEHKDSQDQLQHLHSHDLIMENSPSKIMHLSCVSDVLLLPRSSLMKRPRRHQWRNPHSISKKTVSSPMLLEAWCGT